VRPRAPKTASWLLVVPLVLVGLALTPTAIAGLRKTPRDRVGISYGGGPFEGVHYQRIVQPGSNLFFNGFFDSLYLYPSDQVNYIISQAQDDGNKPTADAVVAPTHDRVQVTYQAAIYFKLNSDLLQDFHEQLGLRYHAYTTDGWNKLIRDTFRQQIENTLQEETRKGGRGRARG
jgi:SPFH domain / Band 7 family